MYKISLVNMPFASLQMPSLALTQLKTVTEERLGEKVRVKILYVSHEFAHYIGLDLYSIMTSSLAANNSGLGDWFFRQVAFPDEADNTVEYFRRYFPRRAPQVEARKKEVEAKRATLDHYLQQLVIKHRLDKEDLVGFTSMFAQNVGSFALARKVKERNPKVVTVVGGANCEAPMGRELVAHVDALDFTFSGPALFTFPQFIEHQIDGEQEKCEQLRGVYSKENAEALTGRSWSGQELPIEVPVALDYESFLGELERNFPNQTIKPSLTFETSRGCWWGERSHCTFCGLNGSTMAYRGMPSEMAVELFESMFEQYSDRCSRFDSVDNILPRQYLKEVLPKLNPPEHVKIFYEVKADLKENEMKVLADASVTKLQPGIESINSGTLKLMGKGTTAFGNVAFLKYCVKFSVEPVWNLLIGFPGEEESVYKKYLADIPLLVHLPPPSGAHPVRFDRYSPYYTRVEEYGLDLKPYDFYSFIYPFGDESIANMAYFFEDRNYSADYLRKMVAWSDRLNTAVRSWQDRWNPQGERPKRAELRLEHKGEATVVYDSRFGEPVEHQMDDLSLEILSMIATRGLKLSVMARRAKADLGLVEDTIGYLRQLKLLFEENGRYLSVIQLPGRQEDDFSTNLTLAARGAGAGNEQVTQVS